MKVQVFSDLHNELQDEPVDISNKADVVVLAGDIHQGVKGIEWAKATIKHKPVIYVLGNHCLWGGKIPKTYHDCKAAAKGSNIIVLEKDKVHLEGVNFFGATFWTSYDLFGNPKVYGQYCQEHLNDYKKIRRLPTYSKFRSIDKNKAHLEAKSWLGQALKMHASETNLVITHHAPSSRSLADECLHDPLSADYASNLEGFIEQHNIALWVHGHTHNSSDYRIGGTRVVSNPRGYVSELNPDFKPCLLIDV